MDAALADLSDAVERLIALSNSPLAASDPEGRIAAVATELAELRARLLNAWDLERVVCG